MLPILKYRNVKHLNDCISNTLLEIVEQCNMHLKAPVSHEAESSGMRVTSGGYQDGPHFPRGYKTVIICSSTVKNQSI